MLEESVLKEIVSGVITAYSDQLLDAIKDGLGNVKDRVKSAVPATYTAYLRDTTEKIAYSKTFLVRDRPSYIYNFYEPLDVKCGNLSATEVRLSKFVDAFRTSVITGIGGCGKSTLLRHLYLDTVAERDRIPVFLELRKLNASHQSLQSLVIETLQLNGLELSEDVLAKLIKQGRVVLLLDGFDELEVSRRRNVAGEIQDLSDLYPKATVILSSRPDNLFQSWPRFRVFETQPLSLEKACRLIRKSPIDADIKKNFERDLRGGLYSQQESFVANPLLLTIMMLTYGQNAEIPNKLSAFYNQAYEALFQRHDAVSKGGFQRPRQTKLDMQDFEVVFSAFSLRTYEKQSIHFATQVAIEHLGKVKGLVAFDFDEESFLEDARQAVCLLVDDGLFLTFTHRSLQEYFTALYISRAPSPQRESLVDHFSSRVDSDSVVAILYELDQLLVEECLFLPALDQILAVMQFKRTVGVTHYARFLKYVFKEIHCYSGAISAAVFSSEAGSLGMRIWGLLNLMIRLENKEKYVEKHDGVIVPIFNNDQVFPSLGDDDLDFSIPIRELPIRHSVFSLIIAQNSFVNIEKLRWCVRYRAELERRIKQRRKSLDEILEG